MPMVIQKSNEPTEHEVEILNLIHIQSKVTGYAHKNFIAGNISDCRLEAEVLLNELCQKGFTTLDLYGKMNLTEFGKQYLQSEM